MKKNILLIVSLASIISLHAKVEEVQSAAEFDELLSKGKPVLLKFSSDGCKPCEVMEPVYAEKSNQYTDVIFVAVHNSKQPAAARDLRKRYNAHSSPIIIIFDAKGNQVDKIEGGPMTAKDAALDIDSHIMQAKGIVPKAMPMPAPTVPVTPAPGSRQMSVSSGSCPIPFKETTAPAPAPMQQPRQTRQQRKQAKQQQKQERTAHRQAMRKQPQPQPQPAMRKQQ